MQKPGDKFETHRSCYPNLCGCTFYLAQMKWIDMDKTSVAKKNCVESGSNVIAYLYYGLAYLRGPLIVEQNSEHNVHGTHTTNTCKFMVPNTTNLAKQTMFRQIFKVVDSSNVFVHSSIYCNYLAGRAMPILKPNTCMRNHASSPRPKLRN